MTMIPLWIADDRRRGGSGGCWRRSTGGPSCSRGRGRAAGRASRGTEIRSSSALAPVRCLWTVGACRRAAGTRTRPRPRPARRSPARSACAASVRSTLLRAKAVSGDSAHVSTVDEPSRTPQAVTDVSEPLRRSRARSNRQLHVAPVVPRSGDAAQASTERCRYAVRWSSGRSPSCPRPRRPTRAAPELRPGRRTSSADDARGRSSRSGADDEAEEVEEPEPRSAPSHDSGSAEALRPPDRRRPAADAARRSASSRGARTRATRRRSGG